ncbi:DUF1120 domain-containing protein [Pseudomonas sp. 18.1.10]|uniref:DUF1120 domain-containing protein n=1 Tax=Pseudomonas sp. 18.1.10 TaxID=2969302 RepID=UPI00214FA46C|nr:DUF1120 domain-containing protein [Pseudomonas sp. 18.1.10]MCR4539250.1 DUF1120 domain-containing protein [Pseudomonas sp. 18.1.10]
MNKLINVMAAVIALGGVGQVLAASNVELNVNGRITPAACTPALSGGGVVDHGKISRKDLNPGNVPTALPVATLRLSVECAAPTLIAIKSRDNRAGSSGEEFIGKRENFGLGLVDGDKKVGWYLLKTLNGQADGVDRPMIESDDGASWSDATHPDLVWQVEGMRSVSERAGSDSAPLPLKAMSMDVRVETMIVRLQFLPPLGEDIPLDGSATLDVVYL